MSSAILTPEEYDLIGSDPDSPAALALVERLVAEADADPGPLLTTEEVRARLGLPARRDRAA